MSVDPGAGCAPSQYQGQPGRQYHEIKRGLRPGALSYILRLRASKLQPHIGPSDVVFEFGAGAGWNLGGLNCARRMACDVSDFLAPEWLKMGIEAVDNLESLPDGTADVILCHHVLEHVRDPNGTLCSLRRKAKPTGRIVVHVPWEREGRYRNYSPSEPNHHLYTWNAQTLGNLVTDAGFTLNTLRVRRYGYDRYAANIASRFGMPYKGFQALRLCMVTLRPLWEVECIAKPV